MKVILGAKARAPRSLTLEVGLVSTTKTPVHNLRLCRPGVKFGLRDIALIVYHV